MRTYTALGTPIAERSTTIGGPTNGTVMWLNADRNNTVADEADHLTLAITHRYTDPFGNPRGASATWTSNHTFLNAPTNPTTATVHLAARDYDPTLGRFLTTDPILNPSSPQQTNGYSYANNNPTNNSDPTGLRPADDNGAIRGNDLTDWEQTENQAQAAAPVSQGCWGAGGEWLCGTQNSGGAPSSDAPIQIDPKNVEVSITNPTYGASACARFGFTSVCNQTTDISLADLINQHGPKNYCGWASFACTIVGINQTINCAHGRLSSCVGAVIAIAGDVFVIGKAGQLLRLAAIAADTSGTLAAEAAGADTIVLGHYPEYVDLAKATGGRTFQVPANVWDSMTPEQRWSANQRFLDRAIARGSYVQLATPANAAREGSYFERELQYMQSKGYTVGSDGMSLLPPGSG